MKKLLIALMTLGAFGFTTVAISPAAHAQTTKKKKKSKKKSRKTASVKKKAKKKKKKKSKKKSKKKASAAQIESPSVNLPVNAESAAPAAPGVNKSSSAESLGPDQFNATPTAPNVAPSAKPVHRL